MGYFNAGMLIVNLRYWREKQVHSQFFDYVKSNAERLKCHDQDVLNYLFKDSKLVLPIRYNVLNEYWFDLRYSLISWEFDEQILEAQAHPAIIHLRVFLNHGIRTVSIHGKKNLISIKR